MLTRINISKGYLAVSQFHHYRSHLDKLRFGADKEMNQIEFPPAEIVICLAAHKKNHLYSGVNPSASNRIFPQQTVSPGLVHFPNTVPIMAGEKAISVITLQYVLPRPVNKVVDRIRRVEKYVKHGALTILALA
jgi:hypothetical protein